MNAREGALKVLYEIEVKEAYSNLALNKELNENSYQQVEKGFMTELVYGVLENLIYIDYVIQQFSSIKLKKIHPMALNLLRLGVYQILFLDRIPASAAVNESVNLSKKYVKRSSGFINGILRNIIRNPEKIKVPDQKQDPIAYLSIQYSHPRWMVEQFLKFFTPQFTQELLEANNRTPQLNVRVNTLKTNVADCIESLCKKGFEVEASAFIEEAITIKGTTNLAELDLLKKGHLYIQDFGSMLIGRIVDPKPGDLVVDVCSAPGGKATHLAQLMKNQGRVIARDIHPHKIKLIKANGNRLGTKIVEAEVFNGHELDMNLIEQADRVLVDAPCSGLGIIRRKPEIKYRKKPDDVAEITTLQLDILSKAAQYVKPGGNLIYSTCTIDPRENEEVVMKFLKQSPQFQLVHLGEKYSPMIPGEPQGEMLQLYPNVHGTDGFFMAKLIKLKNYIHN